MFHPDGALGQAADIGVEHIILLHILQHIIADEPDIGRDVTERHGKGRQYHMLPGTVSVGRQQTQLDADPPHQEQPNPIGRHGRGDKDQAPHNLIKPAILVHSAEEADRDAQQQHDHKRGRRQLQRGGQAAGQFSGDCAGGIDIADAEIPLETAQDPVKIPHQKRFVQTQRLLHLRNRLISDNGRLLDSEDDLRRI